MLLGLANWQGGALADGSKWRRPAPRKPRPYKRDPRLDSPFYGYPPALVAEWCQVSVKAARAWKNGTRKPPAGAVALFKLYAEGQVLPPEFKGYRFAKGELLPPGRLGFTPALIEAYELIYKIAMTYARPEVEVHLERMKLAMRDPAPEVGTPRKLAPRWIWDPFFNPLEGVRAVLDGTDQDDKHRT